MCIELNVIFNVIFCSLGSFIHVLLQQVTLKSILCFSITKSKIIWIKLSFIGFYLHLFYILSWIRNFYAMQMLYDYLGFFLAAESIVWLALRRHQTLEGSAKSLDAKTSKEKRTGAIMESMRLPKRTETGKKTEKEAKIRAETEGVKKVNSKMTDHVVHNNLFM